MCATTYLIHRIPFSGASGQGHMCIVRCTNLEVQGPCCHWVELIFKFVFCCEFCGKTNCTCQYNLTYSSRGDAATVAWTDIPSYEQSCFLYITLNASGMKPYNKIFSTDPRFESLIYRLAVFIVSLFYAGKWENILKPHVHESNKLSKCHVFELENSKWETCMMMNRVLNSNNCQFEDGRSGRRTDSLCKELSMILKRKQKTSAQHLDMKT